MNSNLILGTLGGSLFFAWVIMSFITLCRASNKIKILTWVLALIVAFIPFGPYQVSTWFYGFFGQLSFPSLFFTLYGPYQLITQRETRISGPSLYFHIPIFFISLTLFMSALGASMIDVYSWGYGNSISIAISIWALALVFFKQWKDWAFLCLVLCGYALGLSESTNFWHSLTDPLLLIYSLCVIIAHYNRKRKS